MHFFSSVSRSVIQLSTLLITVLAFMPGTSSAASACTHYASPTGTGSGASPSQPFKVANFWAVAKSGSTLCLLDGQYTGSASMITPPSGLSGTALAPITIRALNDGKVRINGQGIYVPIQLSNNDWFIVEGFNASDSAGVVVNITNGSDHNIVRRVCAWNANPDTNVNVWQVYQSQYNLFEDVCGFGSGRKIFSNSQGGNFTTIRRAWGRWEKSTQTGPKTTYEIVYRSYDSIYENIIGTWDETAMGGAPVDQPNGIFTTTGGLDQANQCARSKILGAIAYVTANQKANSWLGALVGARSVDCFDFTDVAVYIEPGTHTNLRPVLGQKFDGLFKTQDTVLNAPFGERNLIKVTEIGGSASSISTDPVNGWTKTNHVDANTVSAAPNIFDGSATQGAHVCKRYKDGVLTSDPLWPWPMNQRIIDAMVESGRTAVDVTATVESMFGPIPNSCKTSSTVVTPPAPSPIPTPIPVVSIPPAPTNLLVAP